MRSAIVQRGIVFDFDGPLFDGRRCVESALLALKKAFYPRLESPGGFRLPLLSPDALIGALFPTLSEIERSAAIEGLKEKTLEEESKSSLVVGAKDVLDYARQNSLKLAVLSRRTEQNLRAILTKIGAVHYFDVISGRDSTTAPKPAREALIETIARLNLELENVVFIGDSDTDLECSQNAGVIFYYSAYSSEPVRECYSRSSAILHEPSEIKFLIQGFTRTFVAPSPTIPPDLIEAVLNGRLSIIAGAGISIDSGMKPWSQQYRDILGRDGSCALLSHYDEPYAVQLIASEAENAKPLYESFRRAFGPSSSNSPNGYHFVFTRIPKVTIWTTNYDFLFEKVVARANPPIGIIRSDRDLLSATHRDRRIIKLNGDFEMSLSSDVERIESWPAVVANEHFDLYQTQRPHLWDAFVDEYCNRSLLIVGASLRDPVVRRILSMARAKTPMPRFNHFMLLKRSTDPLGQREQQLQSAVLARQRITALMFESYDAIREFCAEIALAGRRPIVGFSGNFSHTASSEARIAETLCKALGRSLADTGYRVSSGAGPFVGIPAVAAASETHPERARFYLRRNSSAPVPREAASIIVNTDGYTDVRRRFISEVEILIAMGGIGHSGPISGVRDEITLATGIGLPVILFPQFSGYVKDNYAQLSNLISSACADYRLRAAVVEINDKIFRLPIGQLQVWATTQSHHDIRRIFRLMMLSEIAEPPKSSFSGEHMW